jgi:hypothetical protein
LWFSKGKSTKEKRKVMKKIYDETEEARRGRRLMAL